MLCVNHIVDTKGEDTMYEEILNAIYGQVASMKHMGKDGLKEDMLFVEELGGKSLDVAQLASFLEGEFDVDLPYMKFSKQKTLGDMARFVEESM